jgi:flagellar biosynthesis/type III secretory pathway protein FliH
MAHYAAIRPGRPLRGVLLRRDAAPDQAPAEDPQPSAADLAAIAERTNDLLQAIGDAVNELEDRRRHSLAELQEFAVEVATVVASRVIRTAIDQNTFGVESLVREILEGVSAAQPVEIILHPDDLVRVDAAAGATAPPWASERIRFIADATVARGVCRATAGPRSILSDWRTHLQDIRAILHEELEHAQVERRGVEDANQRVKRFPDRRETA